MKAKRLSAVFSSTILAFSSLVTMVAPTVVHAAGNTCTWTGATDTKFSTATNWTGCTSAAPTNGDNLVFDITSLTANATLNNDLTGLTTGTVTFTGTNSNYYTYTITGNALTLGGDVTGSTGGANTIDTDVTLASDVTVNASGSYSTVYFGSATDATPHTFDTQGHNLTFAGDGANCGEYIMGNIKGNGSVTVNLPNGGVAFDGSNDTYSGAVSVTKGEFGVKAGLGNTTGVTVADGGTLALLPAQDTTYDFPISLSGAGVDQYKATLMATGGFGCGGGDATASVTLSGPVTLNSDITYGGSYNTKVTGTYTANGHKVTNLAGSTGTFTASGTTTQIVLDKRTIAADDKQPTQSAYVSSGEELTLDGTRGDTEAFGGGILKGSGTVAKLTIDKDAMLEPGHSPGCMTVTNGLNEYGTYQAEIGGTDPCTGYDQMKVTGAVDLGGSNGNAQGILDLVRYNNFKPAAGQKYEIIDNDGTDAVQGTFQGLAEGATFKVDNYVFTITYKGGDGNDVVVSVKDVPSTPDTGFAFVSANPLASLAATTIAAAGILVIARKSRSGKAGARR